MILIMLYNVLKRIKYRHVGRKHYQNIVYTLKQCQEFNLLLNQTAQPRDELKNLNNIIVNRLFVGCLFSRIIGNNFPLSIYLSQSVAFHREVQVGEEIRGEIEVIKDLGNKKYQIKTICTNSQNDMVLSGIAIILQE